MPARHRTAALEPLHPNPQWSRPTWQSLTGRWQFAVDAPPPAKLPERIKWDRQIVVPFAPETPASGLALTGYIPACWYRRTFRSPRLPSGGRLILHCGAIDYMAWVWVNGQLVATHEGGYTSFHCDITANLRRVGEQEIVIAAADDPHDLAKPRGKQDWLPEPHSIWYPRTTGIWQPVWLEVVGRNWLERMQWRADANELTLCLDSDVAGPLTTADPTDVKGGPLTTLVKGGPDVPLRMRVVLRLQGQTLAEHDWRIEPGHSRQVIAPHLRGIDDIRDGLLWSPERPNIIEADITLLDEDGRPLDRVSSYCAMRSAGVLGDRFMLNGRPRYLRLALDQGYWPQSGLTPPDDQAARRDVELALAMGFNGVRAHQRIPDPRYLYWADRLGLLVWEEMPAAYRFSTRGVVRLSTQWAEAIQRDLSHPCVVAWVPINESWGVAELLTDRQQRSAIDSLYHLTHAIDGDRPVVGNDGWEMDRTDIIAVHDYDRSPQRLAQRYQLDPQRLLARERPGSRVLLLPGAEYRGQPIMLTEFGGIALRQGDTWGYKQVENPEQLAGHYADLLAAVYSSPCLAGFCYTQFADTYQEANGLLTMDREPKFPLEQIRAATTNSPPGQT